MYVQNHCPTPTTSRVEHPTRTQSTTSTDKKMSADAIYNVPPAQHSVEHQGHHPGIAPDQVEVVDSVDNQYNARAQRHQRTQRHRRARN